MGLVIKDTFDYADGDLPFVSSGLWETLSGGVQCLQSDAAGTQTGNLGGIPVNYARIKPGGSSDFKNNPALGGGRDFRVDTVVNTQVGATTSWKVTPILHLIDTGNWIALVITVNEGIGRIGFQIIWRFNGTASAGNDPPRTIPMPQQPVRIGLESFGGVVRVLVADAPILEVPYSAFSAAAQALYLGTNGRRAGFAIGSDLAGGGEGPLVSEFSITTAGAKPGQPRVVSVTESTDTARVRLKSTRFSSSDDTAGHAASIWQAAFFPGDFASPVWESNLEEQPVWLTLAEVGNVKDSLDPRNGLALGQAYQFRVRHIDDHGAPTDWSEPAVVTVPDPLPTLTTRADLDVGNVWPPAGVPPPSYPDGFREGLIYPCFGGHDEPIRIESRRNVDWEKSGNPAGRRVFAMGWDALSRAETELLWSFYWNMRGPFTHFNLIHPRSAESIRSRFLLPRMSRSAFIESLHRCECSVIEDLT